MILFKSLFLALSLFLFIGCQDSATNEKTILKEHEHICPQCNMPFSINKHSSIYKEIKFDDIGCMILWAKEHDVDLSKIETKIYLNEQKKYINSKDAYYKIDGRTPMNYGFVAYEKNCDECIKFDEVILKMLRGEHLGNPKIRKKVLGY